MTLNENITKKVLKGKFRTRIIYFDTNIEKFVLDICLSKALKPVLLPSFIKSLLRFLKGRNDTQRIRS